MEAIIGFLLLSVIMACVATGTILEKMAIGIMTAGLMTILANIFG